MSNQAKSDAGALSGIRMSNTPSAIRQPPDLGAEIKACERAGRAGSGSHPHRHQHGSVVILSRLEVKGCLTMAQDISVSPPLRLSAPPQSL